MDSREFSFSRRAVLATLGSGCSVVITGCGAILGCGYSPAELSIANYTWKNLNLQITVNKDKEEIYSARKEVPSDVDYQSVKDYKGEIPIGCSFPTDLIVSVETDEFGSASETIRFPRPEPHDATSVGSSIRIEVRPTEINISGSLTYTVV